jgi:hypothetical protein
VHTKRWQRNIALPDSYFGFCEKTESIKSSTTRQELLWSKTLTSSSKWIITKHIDHQAQNPRPSKNHKKRKLQKVTTLDVLLHGSWCERDWKMHSSGEGSMVQLQWKWYGSNFVTSSETYHTDVKISARAKQTTVPVAQMR